MKLMNRKGLGTQNNVFSSGTFDGVKIEKNDLVRLVFVATPKYEEQKVKEV